MKLINETRRMQQLAGLIKEDTDPNAQGGFEKVIDISDEAANYFRYDVDKLQDEADNRGFNQYDGGITGYDGYNPIDTGSDYQWVIAMGDDFPHAVVIKNKQMLKDPAVNDYLKRLKSRNW